MFFPPFLGVDWWAGDRIFNRNHLKTILRNIYIYLNFCLKNLDFYSQTSGRLHRCHTSRKPLTSSRLSFLSCFIFTHLHAHDIYILWSTWRRTGGASACKQLPTSPAGGGGSESLSLLFMCLAFFLISKVILPNYWLVYSHSIVLICLPMRFAVLTLEPVETMGHTFQPGCNSSSSVQMLEWRVTPEPPHCSLLAWSHWCHSNQDVLTGQATSCRLTSSLLDPRRDDWHRPVPTHVRQLCVFVLDVLRE